MSTATPQEPQRMRALAIATQRKRERSASKRELAARPMIAALRLAAEHITDPPAHLATMTVHELLRACRWINHARARQIRSRLIPESRTLGGLSEFERRELLASIDAYIARSHSKGAVERRRAA